jgi:hypothetical protein
MTPTPAAAATVEPEAVKEMYSEVKPAPRTLPLSETAPSDIPVPTYAPETVSTTAPLLHLLLLLLQLQLSNLERLTK